VKRLPNTLFVMTQGAYLSRDGETVLVRVAKETKLRVPIHTLDGIVCFGRVSCSPPLMKLCSDRNVTISFMSKHGRFWARVHGPVNGNVLLRREQYRRADSEEKSVEIARSVVIAKIMTCRTVLSRALRDHSAHIDTNAIEEVVDQLALIGQTLAMCQNLETLRGHEGEAARIYFGVFDHLILVQKEHFFFRERSRRPPLDNMNSLMSFLYTLLTHDVVSCLETVGLDPAVGYLHRDRPGRPGLSLDLIEELRPVIADRLALSLVNRQQVKGSGFKTTETGAIQMDDDTRKQVLVAYQKRKQEEIRHPFLDEKISVGLIPYAQAMLMARHLRGDLDGYPPFIWK
jgi:CRISP-associated protein Cas1